MLALTTGAPSGAIGAVGAAVAQPVVLAVLAGLATALIQLPVLPLMPQICTLIATGLQQATSLNPRLEAQSSI